MIRYVPLDDRPPARYVCLDMHCTRCHAAPGRRCRRVRWFPERLYVAGGRVRRLPAGSYVVEEELRRCHDARRQAAREATAGRRRTDRSRP